MTQYLTLNLEEQVRKNASDIQAIVDGNIVLGELGIRVVGQVELPADLPPAEDYIGTYGDAYLVGPAAPYDYYIFTRPFEGEDVPQWFNIGQFPVPGPQGPAGVVTQGDRGERGSVWYSGQSDPSTFSPAVYEQQVFLAQDMYLNTSSGNVFQYDGKQWRAKGNILGPAGANGQRGQRGTQWFYGTQNPGQGGVSSNVTLYTGDLYLQSDGTVWRWYGTAWTRITDLTGPQGEQGLPSTAVTIVAELASTSQLPTPTANIRNNAYIIDINGVYHLYVITQVSTTDTTLQWTDMGPHGGTQVFSNGQPIDIFDADTKLNKITSATGSWRLYGVDGSGNQITRTFSSDLLTEGVLCSRGANGVVSVGTPTSANHATTKAYVDNAIANAGGGGGPALHTMSIKLSNTWMDNVNLAWTTKPGYGPSAPTEPVTIDNENGVIIFGGAYSSAGMGKWTTNLDYPDNSLNYYFSMEPICGNNVGGLSTSDDRILCRSYIDLTGIVERNEYGIIFGGTLYYFS